LRISIQETEVATLLTLEGRVAGPWAAELSRVWVEKAPLLALANLSLDLTNVIYADDDGIRVLREIYTQAQPKVVATTPWTQYLAEKIAAIPPDHSDEEQENGNND
jgi:anti-anti-sigma regulatory factor